MGKTLTKKIADQYLKDDFSVDLSTFTQIEDAAAKALASYKGDIALSGLTNLSDASAEALSKREGGLRLNGLTTLSMTAAQALAKLAPAPDEFSCIQLDSLQL